MFKYESRKRIEPYPNYRSWELEFGKYSFDHGYWLVVDLFYDWSFFVNISGHHFRTSLHNNGHLGWGLFKHIWFGHAKSMPDYY